MRFTLTLEICLGVWLKYNTVRIVGDNSNNGIHLKFVRILVEI
nr:hypothetical protein [Mucilaginibacter sp. X4EP1]